MTNKRFSRAGTLLLTGFVAVLALTVGVHAAQTITTQRSRGQVQSGCGSEQCRYYARREHTCARMGVQNSLGYRGIGVVAMLHVPSSFLEWTGIESPSAAALTSGFSGTAGTHIVYLDFSHTVQIEVAGTDTFLIHNGSSIEMTGVVTLIW